MTGGLHRKLERAVTKSRSAPSVAKAAAMTHENPNAIALPSVPGAQATLRSSAGQHALTPASERVGG